MNKKKVDYVLKCIGLLIMYLLYILAVYNIMIYFLHRLILFLALLFCEIALITAIGYLCVEILVTTLTK